jgi:hypothetical protein
MLKHRDGKLFLPGGPDTSGLDGLIGSMYGRVGAGLGRSA